MSIFFLPFIYYTRDKSMVSYADQCCAGRNVDERSVLRGRGRGRVQKELGYLVKILLIEDIAK